MWQDLSEADRAIYESQAAAWRQANAAMVQENIAKLNAEIANKQKDLADARLGKGLAATTLSANRLEEQALQTMATICKSAGFGLTVVEAMRKESITAPAAPPEHSRRAMGRVAVIILPRLLPVPDWLKPICWFRDLFRSAALIVDLVTSGEQVLPSCLACRNRSQPGLRP